MTKSELIDYLAARHDHLPTQAVEAAVKCMIEQMSQALSSGERIEIRGFGSFSLDRRPPGSHAIQRRAKRSNWRRSRLPILNTGKNFEIG